jgi:hypothetical protein
MRNQMILLTWITVFPLITVIVRTACRMIPSFARR